MEILTKENKLLRKKSKRVAKIDDTIHNLAASMFETLYKSQNGIALAAPQVGLHKCVIVISLDGKEKVLINPEIIFKSDELEEGEEGCLSIPGEYIQKKRHKSVTVKYRNLSGHPLLETHTGLMARVLQHEIDHLFGILMDD